MTEHHDHSHHDDHHHDHNHQTNSSGHTLGFAEKMDKLLAHWIHHNEDHLSNYQEWAGRATDENQAGIAAKLEEAAHLTGQITQVFKAAQKLL